MASERQSVLRRHVASFIDNNESVKTILTDADVCDCGLSLSEWLLNLVSERCGTSVELRRDEVWGVLSDPFLQRRVVDSIIFEESSRKWQSMDLPRQERWAEERKVDLADNKVNQAINTMDFVLKVEEGVLVSNLPVRERRYRYDVQMLGTVNLINVGARAVYDYTVNALKNKYSKDSVAKLFRKVYLDHSVQKDMFEWAVLIVCAVPKIFSIRDYLKNKNAYVEFELEKCSDGEDARSLFMSILGMLDKGVNPLFPGSRFRMGTGVDPEVVNRLGGAYWLKKTLERFKAEQRVITNTIHARAVDGFVGKSSLLKVAIAQKSPFSISLSSQNKESIPYPAMLTDFSDRSMVVCMLQSNAIPVDWIGKSVRVTFCVKTGQQVTSYCEFKTVIDRIDTVHEKIVSAKLRLPSQLNVFRRSAQRLNIDSNSISLLEIQQCHTVKRTDGALCRKGVGLSIVCLPTQIDCFRVEDISAAGMRITVSAQQGDALWKVLFVGCELITRLVLPTQAEKDCFQTTILAMVRNVSKNGDGSKSIGLQFLEAGLEKSNGTIAWQALGDNGLWALGDWIFKFGRKWSSKMQGRQTN